MQRRLAVVLLALLTAMLMMAAEVVRPNVLVTSDEGIDAPVLVAPVDALKVDYRITVVAPADDQSAMGHGITYRTPVLVEVRPGTEGVRRFPVHAQLPTCTDIAATALLATDPPALVLSGINRGDNADLSVWISGTVAGAREGALAIFPPVAFSTVTPRGSALDYAAAARRARMVLLRLREAGLRAPGRVVKVEIPHPAGEVRGVTVTRASMAPAKEERYEEKAGPGGERMFVNRYMPSERDAAGTDVQAFAGGFVAVTPLSLDQTDYRGLPALMAIPWCSFEPTAKATP